MRFKTSLLRLGEILKRKELCYYLANNLILSLLFLNIDDPIYKINGKNSHLYLRIFYSILKGHQKMLLINLIKKKI